MRKGLRIVQFDVVYGASLRAVYVRGGQNKGFVLSVDGGLYLERARICALRKGGQALLVAYVHGLYVAALKVEIQGSHRFGVQEGPLIEKDFRSLYVYDFAGAFVLKIFLPGTYYVRG